MLGLVSEEPAEESGESGMYSEVESIGRERESGEGVQQQPSGSAAKE